MEKLNKNTENGMHNSNDVEHIIIVIIIIIITNIFIQYYWQYFDFHWHANGFPVECVQFAM
jgi:hypothetical protein